MFGDLPKRFQEKIEFRKSGCWDFTGAIADDGYGRFWWIGRTGQAHRYAYGLVPEGMELDHLCRNRRCCNPAHLEPVTHLENVRRGANMKRTETHCGNGHEWETNKFQSDKNRPGVFRCRECHNKLNKDRMRRLRAR